MADQPAPGVLQEGDLVHRTEITFLGHRIWLQDDTDASTDASTVALAIAAALTPSPLGDSWRPRIAQIGRAQRTTLDSIASQLLTLTKQADALAALEG